MKNELYHYGVLGMKWGHRKASSISTSGRSKRSRKKYSDDAYEAKQIMKKKVNQMSNAELKKLNERQNLERNHKQLNKSAVAKGVAFLAASSGVMNTALNMYNNSDKLIKTGKKIADKFITK